MNSGELILQLLLGGILGMIGQGLRVVVGLKKLYEKAETEPLGFSSLFQLSKLVLSLFIGFIAGVLAMITTSQFDPQLVINKQMVITLIGSGYAGTDFIEAFMMKYMPSDQSDKTTGAPTNPAVG